MIQVKQTSIGMSQKGPNKEIESSLQCLIDLSWIMPRCPCLGRESPLESHKEKKKVLQKEMEENPFHKKGKVNGVPT